MTTEPTSPAPIDGESPVEHETETAAAGAPADTAAADAERHAEEAATEKGAGGEAATEQTATGEPPAAETAAEPSENQQASAEAAPTGSSPTEPEGTAGPKGAAPAASEAPRTAVPGPRPAPRPRPSAATAATERWGRVDDDGTVYVREGDGERAVGQYPDGTPDEALAYFERKYADLAAQVGLLEQRSGRGANASDVAKSVRRLREQVTGANAVGDLAALDQRLDALGGEVQQLTEQQQEANRAAVAEAIVERTRIVEEAEKLAAADPKQVQWKSASAALDDLFARWQAHQRDGAKLPKGEANELWKRFRTARSTVEQHRRAFFSELDTVHRDARERKQRLVERAEALAGRGAEAIPAYRQLLDEWKTVGRAGKRQDDALWARFRAAGDVLFQAKAEGDAVEQQEFAGNLEAKQALLDEAAPLLTSSDRLAARQQLTGIQRRWDEIGKVPREQVRPIEDRLRAIEQHVKQLEEDHWRRSNPERKARSEDLSSQLTAAIDKLEQELESARASGDRRSIAKAEEALAARRVWLDAISS